MTYEYARVPWEEIGRHAAEGWRLMEIPPMPEMKAMLGQVQVTGVVLYHMEREARAGGTGEHGSGLRGAPPRLVRAVRGPGPESR